MRKTKLWCLAAVAAALLLLAVPAVLTAVIDPYFHYHAPLAVLEYPIDDQRYQNDGIVRNFSYNALITGTSMTENFLTSELDALFGVKSVKVSYSGGTFSELARTVQQALDHNSELELVIFGLDEWFLFAGRELIQASGEYPTYLYDEELLNDVNYLFNKDTFLNDTLGVLEYTRAGKTTTSFDDYAYWGDGYDYQAAAVLAGYDRPDQAREETTLTPELEAQVRDTLSVAVDMARLHPEVTFIYFFPPYSVLNWDSNIRQGLFQRQMGGYALASDVLLREENIQLYSFFDDYATTTDLNNYRDIVHYAPEINSLLLRRIRDGEYRLTLENSPDYWQQVGAFYDGYDYEALLSGGA